MTRGIPEHAAEVKAERQNSTFAVDKRHSTADIMEETKQMTKEGNSF